MKALTSKILRDIANTQNTTVVIFLDPASIIILINCIIVIKFSQNHQKYQSNFQIGYTTGKCKKPIQDQDPNWAMQQQIIFELAWPITLWMMVQLTSSGNMPLAHKLFMCCFQQYLLFRFSEIFCPMLKIIFQVLTNKVKQQKNICLMVLVVNGIL